MVMNEGALIKVKFVPHIMLVLTTLVLIKLTIAFVLIELVSAKTPVVNKNNIIKQKKVWEK